MNHRTRTGAPVTRESPKSGGNRVFELGSRERKSGSRQPAPADAAEKLLAARADDLGAQQIATKEQPFDVR